MCIYLDRLNLYTDDFDEHDEPTIFDVTLPVEGIEQADRVRNMRTFANDMRSNYQDQLLDEVAVVPDVLTRDHLLNHPEVKNTLNVDMSASVGLYLETVKSVNIDFNNGALLLIGNQNKAKSIIDSVILTNPNSSVTIIDSSQSLLKPYASDHVYEDASSSYIDTVRPIIVELVQRIDEYKSSMKRNEAWQQHTVIIADIHTFIEVLDDAGQTKVVNAMEHAKNINAAFVLVIKPDQYNRPTGPIASYIKGLSSMVVLSKMGDVPRLSISASTLREPEVAIDEANFVEQGGYNKFKMLNNN